VATHYSNGFSWYVQWTEGGKRKKRRIGRVGEITEADVKLAAKAKEIELRTGRVVLSTGLLFGNFVEQYKEWHASEYPSSHYRVAQILDDHLTPAFEFMPVDGITHMQVDGYKAKRMRSVKSATVAKELRTLKAVINKACEWQLILANPISHVKPPRNLDSSPPRWYSASELSAIYAANEKRQHWWRFMVNTGLRRTEALQVKMSDIDGDSLRVLSSKEARTKSGRWREIPLNDAALEALEQITPCSSFLLPRMVPRSLSRHFTHDSAAVGGSIHCLRHTYCSHLVTAGVPLRTVQMLAGHSSFATTEKYAHLAPGHMRKEASKISL